MNIQRKLQELNEMYQKGLITADAYNEQQKVLLALHANANNDAPTASQSNGQKSRMPLWQQVIILILVIFGGIWVTYRFANREGKDSINQFVALTGIGTQVIPWTDRADPANDSALLIEKKLRECDATIFPEFANRVEAWHAKTLDAEITRLINEHGSYNAMVRHLVSIGTI